MRHAILITAYTDFLHLVDLVTSFDERFDVYIHVDRRVYLSATARRLLENLPGVKAVGQEYAVNWGCRAHIDAILWLCRRALEGSPDAAYLHLISGTDLLLKPPQAFCDFFDAHQGQNFMEVFPLPTPRWHGGWMRLAWRHPLDRLDLRNAHELAIYCRYLRCQRATGKMRPLPDFPVYGGSTWWDLTREAVDYVCTHANWNGWYDRLADTYVPEEVYVQTLLMNSPLRDTLTDRLLRYIDWTPRRGHSPAVLDETDLPALLASDAMFARKVDSRTSARLIDHINRHRDGATPIL